MSEVREIKISLETAKTWYRNGSNTLKALALQAFTKEELSARDWYEINSYDIACESLTGLSKNFVNNSAVALERLGKINTIRLALNGDWRPTLDKSPVWFPNIRFFKDYEKMKDHQAFLGGTILGEIKVESRPIYVHGDIQISSGGLLNDFGLVFGYAEPRTLFACKSKEIAGHFMRLFGMDLVKIYFEIHGYRTE